MGPITCEVREKLIRGIEELESRFPKGLVGIVLFGSHARNQAKITSDVDIALVFETLESQRREDKPIIDELLSSTFSHLKIDLFCTTVDKLLNTQEKFDANYWIREEGDVIWTAIRI